MLRTSPRALVLWIAAAIVAIATGAIVASDLAALHRHARDLGPEVDVVVARYDLFVGSAITGDDLTQRRVHRSQLPAGALTNRDAVTGRVVTSPVLRGGFVAERNLAARSRQGLDGALPNGSRAIRIVVTDAVRPRRGASVDVLATFDDGSSTSSGEATVIAEGVLVLAVDGTRTDEGAAATGVTLLVSPDQARGLAHAATHGVVTVALVPPEDATR